MANQFDVPNTLQGVIADIIRVGTRNEFDTLQYDVIAERIMKRLHWEAKAYALNCAVASRRDHFALKDDQQSDALAKQNIADALLYEQYFLSSPLED